MQTQLANSRPSKQLRATAPKLAPQPPIILQVPTLHPVYGTTPIGREGFTLERQSIYQLNAWHLRAVNLSAEYVKKHPRMDDDDPEYDELFNCRWGVFNAAFKADVLLCGAVNQLLQIVCRHARSFNDEGILSLDQLETIGRLSALANAPLVPKKKLGKLQRGRKLTRFGLLHRYQAFLIQELETIGWHVYGERDYPMMSRMNDHAVNLRCKAPDARGNLPIFFSERQLPVRARKVLKSLRIDTERNDDVPARRSRKGAR